MDWFLKDQESVVTELQTDAHKGLSSSEVEQRLTQYGTNELKHQDKKSMLSKIKDQLLDPMILILIAAAILSSFVGSPVDAIVIVAIVLINGALSIYQEGKAEQALEALKKMASPLATVIRDGQDQEIESSQLVPGDLVILETGDIVPADLRLLESHNLKIDESSLTGESVPVEKNAQKTLEADTQLGDRKNMAYSSTIVSYGRGRGLVIGTGEKTEIGSIATSLAQAEEEQTPLQKKLAQLSKMLGILVVAICAVVFFIGFVIYRNEPLEMFMTAISLAVAAIPEGLPAIVTIVLSLGMKRMADRNAIVKKLLAVETLGTTTVICSDKTGTLTQNEMTVKKVYVDFEEVDVTGNGYEPDGRFMIRDKELQINDVKSLYTLLNIAALTNDARLNNDGDKMRVIGDPTEGALITLSSKLKITKDLANKNYPRIAELPFDSDRKMMSTFHENYIENKITSFTKGAPDIILERCTKILEDGKIRAITSEDKEKIRQKNSVFSLDSLRVLAYAFKIYDRLPEEKDDAEKDMIFVGLTGMIDPAREEAKDAIIECRKAGIRPIMITGDYLETAYAIGKTLGICESQDEVILGSMLNDKTDEEIREIVKTKNIYARVSPENKVQIVTALRRNGHIAAMTGDGVNDAPAIKKADIGVSMGITGTDVAKNTSDLILTDDNFTTIVHAVEEGRIIYQNMKKFISFLLSCNIGEILIVLIAIILDLPAPFIPIQLLWLNLVTDSFPALALGVEQGEEDIMNEPPRDPNEPIIDKQMRLSIILQSLAITASTLFAFHYGLNHFDHHVESARTVAFATLITAELLRSYSVRSFKHTVFHLGVFSNLKLVLGTAFSFFLMLLVIYVPAIAKIFQTIPLHLEHWIVILPAAFFPFVVGELVKLVRGQKQK